MNLPRHAELWLAPYLKDRLRRAVRSAKPKRAWVVVADHYEPLGRSRSADEALRKVATWSERWPRIADDAPKDAAGHRPQYTFFYPQEEYRHDLVEAIAGIVRLGVGDVEVHLHHDNEQRESFIRKVTEYCHCLTDDHGLLRQQGGRTVFGFIHGNWALDNSRPDGKWCGLSGEIALLRDLGCYADLTMPSLPSATQGRVVNKIYWCTNDADNRPRSFDRGIEATVGGGRQGDLLMITGPLGLRFGERLLPRLETGELAGYDLPTPARVHRWFDLAPTIGDELFLKLYTHGAQERNMDPLLGGGLSNLFRWLAEEADRRGIEVHWATAWQMYQTAAALIHGRSPVSNIASAKLEARANRDVTDTTNDIRKRTRGTESDLTILESLPGQFRCATQSILRHNLQFLAQIHAWTRITWDRLTPVHRVLQSDCLNHAEAAGHFAPRSIRFGRPQAMVDYRPCPGFLVPSTPAGSSEGESKSLCRIQFPSVSSGPDMLDS